LPSDYVVDFPYLRVALHWIQAHCIVPDGFSMGDPFAMYDWQEWCSANHYRVKSTATRGQLAPAFYNRRSQVVAPQKTGKGPWLAALVCCEAVGPAVFDGFALGGEAYDCAEHGCACGWGYEYAIGEPMGIPWPKPLIQILATSEDQTDNIYRPLQAMARHEFLADQMRVGEGFIRLPNDGRIDPVTSKAQSKLGNPITFAAQDEVGLYGKSNGLIKVAETQRRGLAGMGGRSISTTNAWDPTENSDAQITATLRVEDVFRFHRLPPANLSYANKVDRRKIHGYVYQGSTHIDLDGIEAEAAELMERDPAQAERFYGNRLVQGAGTWLVDGLWPGSEDATRVVPDGTEICLGFDGSDNDDWTAIRARTIDGFRFTPTYGPDKRPSYWNPAEWNGQIPRVEVNACVDELFRRYKVKRMYCDPHDWQSEIGDWALKHGDKVVMEWATYRIRAMYEALTRSVNDLISGRSTHDACIATSQHVGNARKLARPGDSYILGKPTQHQKIDLAMCDVLAHEAGEDALADGWATKKTNYIWTA
jgi:hypothetical protein